MTKHLSDDDLRQMAMALRFLAADAVESAGTGHPGMPLGMADLATTLFARHLTFDAGAPSWPDRDRFILSNGHGSMLLYGLLHLTGYADVTLDEVRRFRKAGARAAGHPERGHFAGIESTTGPLGQGIATAVGMAIAEQMLAAEFGADLVNHRTWVFAGDGCLMEGVSHEAISLAGHLGLSKLTVVFDDNQTTIDGATSVSTSDDQRRRFEASNWATVAVDGHDVTAIDAALEAARASDRPTLIAARTRIGFGAPTKVGKSVAHGSPLGAEEIAAMRSALGWTHAAFEIPEALTASWRSAGERGGAAHAAWSDRFGKAAADVQAEFSRRMSGKLKPEVEATVVAAISAQVAKPTDMPVRQASQKATGVLATVMPELVGGSADLTGSVLSRPDNMTNVAPGSFGGRHISYGVREHGMAAAMNGIALHGGFIPYGGTYLTFSDYARPSIRLAALMEAKSIFLFSHDSIGVGEDGPTHQPIEHVAALRAIPGLKVYRPADPVEALECWYDAVAGHGPSVMIVARQKAPQVRLAQASEMLARRGAYILAGEGDRDATLLASGSEVALALATRNELAKAGIQATVVSMPCWETFAVQDAAYQSSVLGDAPRFAIEAASPFGWERYTGRSDRIFGVETFGFSAPGPAVYEHFELTPTALAAKIRDRI